MGRTQRCGGRISSHCGRDAAALGASGSCLVFANGGITRAALRYTVFTACLRTWVLSAGTCRRKGLVLITPASGGIAAFLPVLMHERIVCPSGDSLI